MDIRACVAAAFVLRRPTRMYTTELPDNAECKFRGNSQGDLRHAIKGFDKDSTIHYTERQVHDRICR